MWNPIRINEKLILIKNFGELKQFYCKTEVQTKDVFSSTYFFIA